MKIKKRILEVYSDLPRALLADFNFLKELRAENYLCFIILDQSGSASIFKLKDFKVLKAPAFATLLTLADLGGIADLLSGEGMSFDILEIKLKEDKNTQTIEEI